MNVDCVSFLKNHMMHDARGSDIGYNLPATNEMRGTSKERAYLLTLLKSLIDFKLCAKRAVYVNR